MKQTKRATTETKRIIQSGHLLTILNDYSGTATGEYITLDFSNIAANIPTLADESLAVIRSMYEGGAASPSYFKIMIPAIEKFSEFAKMAGVRSFAEYCGDDFLAFLKGQFGERFSTKYLHFCWSIGEIMKSELAGERK